ncbi:MAG: hypothetical protein M3O91_03265 [Chloroflexota bacterium]|nr:hypothetical protein [Chloroflexota bacterium]
MLILTALLGACGGAGSGAAGPVAATAKPASATPAAASAGAATEPPKDYGYGARPSAAPDATLTGELKIADNPKLGKILTASNGATLYTFKRDSANTSNCTDACATTWPPYVVSGAVIAPPDLVGKVGTAPRSDGSMQVTYNGMPLYRYGADRAPGDVNGEGIGGNWFSVKNP